MKTILAFLLFVSLSAFAVDRSTTERYRFVQANPCPANGQKTYVKCSKGGVTYNIDHPVPLSDGGKDVAENMQWLRVEAKRAKDRVEYALSECRKSKHPEACPTVNWKAAPKGKS